jgi:hypothetical protein
MIYTILFILLIIILIALLYNIATFDNTDIIVEDTQSNITIQEGFEDNNDIVDEVNNDIVDEANSNIDNETATQVNVKNVDIDDIKEVVGDNVNVIELDDKIYISSSDEVNTSATIPITTTTAFDTALMNGINTSATIPITTTTGILNKTNEMKNKRRLRAVKRRLNNLKMAVKDNKRFQNGFNKEAEKVEKVINELKSKKVEVEKQIIEKLNYMKLNNSESDTITEEIRKLRKQSRELTKKTKDKKQLLNRINISIKQQKKLETSNNNKIKQLEKQLEQLKQDNTNIEGFVDGEENTQVFFAPNLSQEQINDIIALLENNDIDVETATTSAETTTTQSAETTTTQSAETTTTQSAETTTTQSPTTTSAETATTLALNDYNNVINKLDDLISNDKNAEIPNDLKIDILELTQTQRDSLCDDYCELYSGCTPLCNFLGCENCTNTPEPTNNSYRQPDELNQAQVPRTQGNTHILDSPPNPMNISHEGDGESNIFAPYVVVHKKKPNERYNAYVMSNPHDPNYYNYINNLS